MAKDEKTEGPLRSDLIEGLPPVLNGESSMLHSSVNVIAVAGPSCAGKTELAKRLAHELGAAVLLLDSYYRDLSFLAPAERVRMNFDDPCALEHELLIAQVQALSRGETVEQPIYDFATHTRLPGGVRLAASDFLIVEGLFALYWPELRALAGTKVFVNAPDEVCLRRRQLRDVAERGRTSDSVAEQYAQTVQPMAALYVRPTAKHADLVLSGEQRLSRSVDSVLQHVRCNGAWKAILRAGRNEMTASQALPPKV